MSIWSVIPLLRDMETIGITHKNFILLDNPTRYSMSSLTPELKIKLLTHLENQKQKDDPLNEYVDVLINFVNDHEPDAERYRDFLWWMDKIKEVRGMWVYDYIPELDPNL